MFDCGAEKFYFWFNVNCAGTAAGSENAQFVNCTSVDSCDTYQSAVAYFNGTSCQGSDDSDYENQIELYVVAPGRQLCFSTSSYVINSERLIQSGVD